jgi:hypothetical protein
MGSELLESHYRSQHSDQDEGLMNNALDQNLVTTTAATQQTEPEVVAAVASGDGQATEQAIRERAYAIWEEEGRPDARHLDHWLRAEAEINGAVTT